EFTREYITLDEYKKYIQPTRRQPDPRGKCESEVEFCKRFYEAHRQIVTYAVSALIAADTDPEAIHKTLKTAFLKLWLKSNGEPFTRI
ncbi:MAG: hypothetical protein LBR54_03240, partial [Oscillospiraceae bacterium]|nr:hypothetical protein [Oscillospiraceae bacterium]